MAAASPKVLVLVVTRGSREKMEEKGLSALPVLLCNVLKYCSAAVYGRILVLDQRFPAKPYRILLAPYLLLPEQHSQY